MSRPRIGNAALLGSVVRLGPLRSNGREDGPPVHGHVLVLGKILNGNDGRRLSIDGHGGRPEGFTRVCSTAFTDQRNDLRVPYVLQPVE